MLERFPLPANDNNALSVGAQLIHAGRRLMAMSDEPGDVLERAGRKLLARGRERLRERR
jgi:hypothetical protein